MSELFLIKLTAKAVWYLAAFLVEKFPKRKGFKSFLATFTPFVEIVGAM